jgi:hypothetical protein
LGFSFYFFLCSCWELWSLFLFERKQLTSHLQPPRELMESLGERRRRLNTVDTVHGLRGNVPLHFWGFFCLSECHRLIGLRVWAEGNGAEGAPQPPFRGKRW